MGHLQLYNRAGSFKEFLIYYETTIEWSLESLAEETIKGIPNGICFQCQEIQKVVILDVCLKRGKKKKAMTIHHAPVRQNATGLGLKYSVLFKDVVI